MKRCNRNVLHIRATKERLNLTEASSVRRSSPFLGIELIIKSAQASVRSARLLSHAGAFRRATLDTPCIRCEAICHEKGGETQQSNPIRANHHHQLQTLNTKNPQPPPQ